VTDRGHGIVGVIDGAPPVGVEKQNPQLGFDLLRRFIGVLTDRLQATRVRLLDFYGHPATDR